MCFIHNLLFLYARHIALSISTMGWFSVWNPQLKCDDFRISLRLQTSMEWSNQDETAPSAICKLSPHHFYVRNVYNEHLGGGSTATSCRSYRVSVIAQLRPQVLVKQIAVTDLLSLLPHAQPVEDLEFQIFPESTFPFLCSTPFQEIEQPNISRNSIKDTPWPEWTTKLQ